mgnify:CR=1 FL=1
MKYLTFIGKENGYHTEPDWRVVKPSATYSFDNDIYYNIALNQTDVAGGKLWEIPRNKIIK